MYRAYDRCLYERPRDASASATTSLLRPEHLDRRVVVHPLLFCPPLPHGTRYILVKRDWPGTRNVLGVGRAMSAHDSSNLAAERLRAARLGANEVHVLPPLNDYARSAVPCAPIS
jgi:hypothetical protein